MKEENQIRKSVQVVQQIAENIADRSDKKPETKEGAGLRKSVIDSHIFDFYNEFKVPGNIQIAKLHGVSTAVLKFRL